MSSDFGIGSCSGRALSVRGEWWCAGFGHWDACGRQRSCHCIICTGCGRVLGFLYFKTLMVWFNYAHWWTNVCICGYNVAQFVIFIHSLWNSGLPCLVSVSVLVSRKTVLRGGGAPATEIVPAAGIYVWFWNQMMRLSTERKSSNMKLRHSSRTVIKKQV